MSDVNRSPSDEEHVPRFEEAISELEQIVERLERGQIGLDEALAEYERGIRLIRHCRELLQKAEQRIEILTGIGANEQPVTQPFEEDELSLEDKREQRSRRRGIKDSSKKESENQRE